MTFLLVNFAVKNAMFNLNENNRFVMDVLRAVGAWYFCAGSAKMPNV